MTGPHIHPGGDPSQATHFGSIVPGMQSVLQSTLNPDKDSEASLSSQPALQIVAKSLR